MPRIKVRPVRQFAIALGSMILAVSLSAFVRELMSSILDTNVPFITFYPAVAWVTYRFGSRWGAGSIVLSGLTATFLFLPDVGSWRLASPATAVALMMFAITSLMLWWIVKSLRVAHQQSTTAHELLTATLASMGDGVICTDVQGNITRMNAVAERLTEWRNQEAMGLPLSQVFHVISEHSRLATPNLALCAIERGCATQNETLRLVSRTGTEFIIDDSAAAIQRDSTVLGAVIVFRDVTQERKLAQESRRTIETLNSLVASAPVGIAIFDHEMRFRQVNTVLANMNGVAVEDHIGKSIAEVVPNLANKVVPMLEQVLQTNATLSDYILEGETTAAPGTQRCWREGWFPIPGPGGQPMGVGAIVQEITDQRRSEEALREADRRKDEFLATLAHELRNPLAPIKYALDLLKQDCGHAEQRQYAITTMDRQVDHMVRLIDDLLDVSRITRKKLTLRRDVINLCDVLHPVIESCRPHCAAVGHELVVTGTAEPIYIDVDPIRFAQILNNLLNNACKYTRPGGRIEIAVSPDEQQVTVRVKDNGIGIPAEVLPHVFDMFAQADTALERSQGGLGIGLSLVKWLVEMHGGSVAVSSPGINQGSEFSIFIPLAVRQSASSGVQPTEQVAVAEGLRYLVVDDSPDIANTLALLLQLQGNETMIASDGVDAVEKTASFAPQVILLDIGLPRMNGYDACRQIRQLANGNQPVIVAMTGWGQEDDRKKSESAGFDGHLVKPVDQNVLQTLLSSLLLNKQVTTP